MSTLRPPKARTISSGSFLLSPAEVYAFPTRKTRILDATWFMPNSQRDPKQEFAKKRLPGAQYLDLDEVAAPSDMGLKHMMPSPQQFKEACEKFGITRDHSVILYDTHGVFSSPRALFMFKAFGHEKSFVLNGGLPLWNEQGYPLDDSTPTDEAMPSGGLPLEEYPPVELDPGIIRSYADMLRNATLDFRAAEIVLDARPTARFKGSAPEPRPGLPSGHMPNSISIPFSVFLEKHEYKSDPSQGTFTTMLDGADLRKAFVDSVSTAYSGQSGEEMVDRILRGEQAVVASCGSGMTAAVVWLAIHELGRERPVPLYDESWAGYAARAESPIIVDAQAACV